MFSLIIAHLDVLEDFELLLESGEFSTNKPVMHCTKHACFIRILLMNTIVMASAFSNLFVIMNGYCGMGTFVGSSVLLLLEADSSKKNV